jgi:hypothetical protein
MILKSSIILIMFIRTLSGNSQRNEVVLDSVSSNDFHYRLDFGFSIYQQIIGPKSLKYNHNIYMAFSKANPNWKFTPSISFLYSNTNHDRDSTYYGKKFGGNSYYLNFRLIKNNFPKREKYNFYYGVLLGGFYSNHGEGRQGEYYFKEFKSITLSPLIGFEFKLVKKIRFFSEFQLGAVYEHQDSKMLKNNVVFQDFGKSNRFYWFHSYTPFLFGLSFIIN